MSFAEPNLILSFTSEVSKLSIGQVPDGQLVCVVVGPALPARHMVLVMADLYLTASGKVEPFQMRGISLRMKNSNVLTKGSGYPSTTQASSVLEPAPEYMR